MVTNTIALRLWSLQQTAIMEGNKNTETKESMNRKDGIFVHDYTAMNGEVSDCVHDYSQRQAASSGAVKDNKWSKLLSGDLVSRLRKQYK